MLASIVRQAQFTPLAIHLRVGVGIPSGEGCSVTESVDVLPSLTPQLTTTAAGRRLLHLRGRRRRGDYFSAVSATLSGAVSPARTEISVMYPR